MYGLLRKLNCFMTGQVCKSNLANKYKTIKPALLGDQKRHWVRLAGFEIFVSFDPVFAAGIHVPFHKRYPWFCF